MNLDEIKNGLVTTLLNKGFVKNEVMMLTEGEVYSRVIEGETLNIGISIHTVSTIEGCFEIQGVVMSKTTDEVVDSVSLWELYDTLRLIKMTNDMYIDFITNKIIERLGFKK